jgi:hypothetical protein
MKVRHLLVMVVASFLGGSCAVLILLNGALPRCTAGCNQLNDPARTPCGNGDVNGSTNIDLADAIYLLSYLFTQGPAPVALADDGLHLTPDQKEILDCFRMVRENNPLSREVIKTIQIKGVNVQIVNGTDSTYDSPNWHGNLILGYQLPRPGTDPEYNRRSGSHNIIVGDGISYTPCGSLAVYRWTDLPIPPATPDMRDANRLELTTSTNGHAYLRQAFVGWFTWGSSIFGNLHVYGDITVFDKDNDGELVKIGKVDQ